VSGACVSVIPFNLTGASATSTVSLNVTFSDPPNPTQANDPTHYCIAAGTPAACTGGDVAVTAASGTGATWTLTTAAQAGSTQYTVFVSGVTRASDGMALTTNSKAFTSVAALGPFTLSGAQATAGTTVEVTYSDAYAAGAATAPASYLIADSADTTCAAGVAPTAAASTSATKVALTSPVAGNRPIRVCVTGALTRLSDGATL
jgi:hypothetical protein